MLEGNIHMIGNFDQCKKINHVLESGPREGEVIEGSYCHIQFDIPKEHLPPIPGDVRYFPLFFSSFFKKKKKSQVNFSEINN